MTFDELNGFGNEKTQKGYDFSKNDFTYYLERSIASNYIDYPIFNSEYFEKYSFEIDNKTGKVVDFTVGSTKGYY